MTASSQHRPFNGINAATGEYGLTLSADELVQRIVGAANAPRAATQREQYVEAAQGVHKSTVRGVRHGVDGTNLSQAGWGLVFAFRETRVDAIQEALQPLLALRAQQAGNYYRVFSGPDAYRPGESKTNFLKRHGVSAGAVDPKKGVPYYLLLIGDPELIPYSFQYQLDVQFAVGRLDFDTLDEYTSYAQAVVAAEKGTLQLTRRADFFSVVNPDDSATAATDDHLVGPLLTAMRAQAPDWEITETRAEAATRHNLEARLGGDHKPALLFTTSHGIEFPSGDPRQESHQGALLCGEWPGPEAWRGKGALPEEYYFAGDHLSSSADPGGMISFHFACFGGGTPQYDDFAGHLPLADAAAARHQVAARPFVAHLPKRLLGHPKGGALAVVSHVDRAWSYSFRHGETSQTSVFESTLARLFEGLPLGWALEYFNNRYAELAADLNGEIDSMRSGATPEPFKLAALWSENNDARNYVVLGDPAVRLAVNGPTPDARERADAITILAGGRPATIGEEEWAQTPAGVQQALTDALRQIEYLNDRLAQGGKSAPPTTRRSPYGDGTRSGGRLRSGSTRGGTTRGGATRSGRTPPTRSGEG